VEAELVFERLPSLSAQTLLEALSCAREGLAIINRAYEYAFLNDAAAEQAGKPKSELVGKSLMECHPDIEETDLFALLSSCMEDATGGSLQRRVQREDGKTAVFDVRVEPCELGCLVLSIDVTERNELEEALRHTQKLDAIGRVAGTLAHDFNNLLSVILSHAELLRSEPELADSLRSSVEAIVTGGQRAADLTRQLLAFSRQQLVTRRSLDLNQRVEECRDMLHRLLGRDTKLEIHLAPGLWAVRSNPSLVDQIIVNLALNARDAMPRGGTLTIETRNVMLDESFKVEHFGVTPGPHVMLSLKDTGTGMDASVLRRIFEPFFTTKPPGRGTGLGLSTVFGIVQQSGGNVWVQSEPGHGSTFCVHLPAAPPDQEQPASMASPTRLHGTETILLAEDQAEVRHVATQILSRYGYRVLQAADSAHALQVCQTHQGTIDLLLTDVGMGGRELAQQLTKLRPEMRLLFMSGYTESAVVQHGVLDSDTAYYQKPIVPEPFVRRVRQVLDRALPR
jgi:PAS domain S-box-containing protein